MSTPTPSLPMETTNPTNADTSDQKWKSETIEETISRICAPIFQKALKEHSQNQMKVNTSVRLVQPEPIFFQPHNFKTWYDFDKLNFHPPKDSYKIINSTEKYFKDLFGCNFKVKKNTIEVINKIDHKKIYSINAESEEVIKNQVNAVLFQKEAESLNALRSFIEKFGGKSEYKKLNKRTEDKVKDGVITKKLNPHIVWHTKVSKKVYNEQNIEFFDSVNASNFIDNAALMRFSPAITSRLDSHERKLNRVLNRLIPALEGLETTQREFTTAFNVHVPVMKGTERGMKGLNQGIKTLNSLLNKNSSQRKLTERFIPKEQKSMTDYIG